MAQAPSVAALARGLPGIALEALSVHIGSQLTAIGPFREAFARLGALARALNATGPRLKRLDFGGGVGVVYRNETPPDLAGYAAAIREAIAGLDVGIVLEPGRHLVAEAGVLLSRVIRVKEGTAKRFAIVDAAMNDLIRPALYEGHHEIVPLKEAPSGAARGPVDVVGPVCESGDFFAQDRELPEVAGGDRIALLSAGAYGFVMASNYNSRRLPAEILVDGNKTDVVRERQSWDDLIAGEKVLGR